VLAALLVVVATDARAQAFPAKAIRVINPAAPGGNSDILFRLLSPKMAETLGQQLFMDYRSGAGGAIGVELTAKSAPDGYTTALVAASFMINPALGMKLPYDVLKDFTPLGLIVDLPAVLVTHPSLPVKSVKELIALARSRPGELSYSSSGPGTLGHLSGALFDAQAKVKTLHVPYKGAGPSVIELMGGHVHFSFVSVPLVIEHVRGGKLRMIAQCGKSRFQTLAEVPTMQEAGLAEFVISSGFGFIGPAGIPGPIAERLNGALAQAIRDPAVRQQLIERSADPIGSSIDEHAAFIRSEVEKWRTVSQQLGIRMQ